jgi:predicted alpha/beta-fold hydrolase
MLPYRPHPLLKSGHLQTLLAGINEGYRPPRNAATRHIDLPDGEQLVVHEELGLPVSSHAPLAILVHGLGGDHSSPYMQRVAYQLRLRDCRVWRVDMRGSGHGFDLAWRPAHAGASQDLAAVLLAARRVYEAVTIVLVGFSLSGNIVLKLLGELAAGHLPLSMEEAGILQAPAVAPPMDLHDCADNMDRWKRRLYARYYLKNLQQQASLKRARWPQWEQLPDASDLKTLRQFDAHYVAPLCGFRDAEHYYTEASSLPWLPQIRTPTEIVLDRHDPIVTWESCLKAQYDPRWVQFTHTDYGGHMGYFGVDDLGQLIRWVEYYVVQRVVEVAQPAVLLAK